MSYVALKPVRLSGNDYLPGQMIEEGHILSTRKRALVRNGCIAEVADTMAAEAAEISAEGWSGDKIPVPIPMPDDESGNAQGICLMMEPEKILAAIRIMQTTPVEAAAKAVEEIEDEDVLILLDSADSRQGVKKAAKKQAEKLTEAQEG
jgi:hypothetical protein